MKSKLRILLTGAGAPGIRGTLYALRTNPDGVTVHVIGTDAQNDVVGKFLVDRFYQVPPANDPHYIEVLLEIARRETVEIIIPQTTGEVAVLAHQKQEFHAEGIKVMVADSAAIDVANDKYELLKIFETLGLPHPDFGLADSEGKLSEFAFKLGYPTKPVVIKPPVSNGMRGLRILKENAWNVTRFLAEKPSGAEISLDELRSILRRGPEWPPLLISEYLPGPEYSVDAFRGKETAIIIPRLRKVIRSGISFTNILDLRPDIVQYTLKAANCLGLQYAFGFQFKLDEENVPKVLECNPRVQGTMVASLFSGVNVIWLAVRETLGECSNGNFEISQNDASFYRFWGGVGVSGEGIHEI
jgi:carbamoyl-phosphate synthase large subunit